MATPAASRRFGSFVCTSCRSILNTTAQRAQRTFTTNAATLRAPLTPGLPGFKNRQDSFLGALEDTPSELGFLSSGSNSILKAPSPENTDQPHRLHIYAHKHNTHITFVQPPKLAMDTASSSISSTSAKAEDKKKKIDVLLSLSTGNIGFKKAGRGSYDAAFQLAAYALKQIQERGILAEINKLEVVLRGFGAGREAATKVLLGTEGRSLRSLIVSVTDSTRLKQGGPRAKRPRRLG